ncbi:head maturation protease, ClpP-related [Bosea sp. BIWAKO-01]|uniref:head maturation protease, ClpP-related n=1 Tax=Bosea sp. BIWAKO-01 TaxID=506668 RepID=UPI000852F9D5|nr:head maturation protease, ClpP-related [Bosea sp. BIWAKO-01]GAU85178.1 prophage Clp protease-like protein [Bosea sp. BIWAKO-01]
MRLVEGNEIRLYGPVGYMDSDGQGFTSSDVIDALAEVGADADISVRINSGGGFAHEGVAIHTALARHGGHVVVSVDGVAASAASLIAMAGNTIVMATGSLMMVHDPSLITIGTAAEHGRGIQQLEATAAAMATVYAQRTGKALANVRAEMAAETWMTADEAVAAGYADRTGTTKARAAAHFDYSVYANVPLTALAAMEAKARAESPEGKAGAASWARVLAKANAGLTAPATAPPAEERAAAIRTEAEARRAVAFGEELVAGDLPVKDALAKLYRLPRQVVLTGAIAGVPSLAELLRR